MVSLCAFAWSMGVLVALAATGWPGSLHECVATASCYCEAWRPGSVAQPANTWSSLTFVAVGLAVAWHAGTATVQARRWSPLHATLFSSAVTLLGPGAMFFHASLMDWAGVLDVGSMYLFLGFWLAFNLQQVLGWSNATFVRFYGASVLLLTFPRVFSPVYGVPLFALVMGVTLATECSPTIRQQRDRRWLWAALVCLALARVAETVTPCDPRSWFQGHAALHVLHAALCGCAYLYLGYDAQGAGAQPCRSP